MQTVITVNLNGNAYQLEETACAALRTYLERAAAQLKDNPDKAEILADLEQAIGDKCRRFLGPHKTVLATAEIEQIVAEMGPVEGSAEPSAGAPRDPGSSSSKAGTDSGAPKRLYRVVDGAMISGVCAGLAAYTHTNVTVIRLIFFILFFGTGGAFALVYIGLMFILPPATTSEEHAAAYGMPFNAQELVDQAKQYSEQFKKGAQQFKEGVFQNSWESRRQWRQQRREWKRQMREQRWAWRQRFWGGPGWSAPAPAATVPPPHVRYPMRILAGIALPIVSIVSIVLMLAFLGVIVRLASSGSVFGVDLPLDLPFPLAILALVAVYAIVAVPLRAIRRASYYALGGSYYGALAMWDAMMSVGFVVLMAWVAYLYVPEVREFIDSVPGIVESLR